MHVHWNNRRRTRLGMQFDPTGTLHIDAPAGVQLDEIKSIAGDHHRWIGYRSRSLKDANVDADQFTATEVDALDSGARALWLGQPLPVAVQPIQPERACGRLEEGVLLVPNGAVGSQQRAQHIRTWYTAAAKAVFAQTLTNVAADIEWLDEVPPWRHRYMRSQWGSCSARGRISLNTHLVKLAQPLIEYVVVHELCHLKYLNHSAKFYELMTHHLPDWQARRQTLNQHASLLLRGF